MQKPELGEDYRVVRPLGSGAAGEVWLVENVVLGRPEAVKVLKEIESAHADRVAQGRFKRELRATQLLEHPNIVETFELGRLADGRLFMTMEYVEGVPLDELLHNRGPLPIALALGIMAEVADALHHAHQAGVVHRDIKPHNILLADHPRGKIVRVLDFGMAKILAPNILESMELSADGAVFGTPQYMSPEQCAGAAPDHRTDIYALGCVAFELLIGEPPFRGPLPILFASHTGVAPPVPSEADPDADIPPALDQLILRCLRKLPDQRFQTGADLCAAIQAVPGYRPLRVFQPES